MGHFCLKIFAFLIFQIFQQAMKATTEKKGFPKLLYALSGCKFD
jgi:hypothetical protein